MYNSQYSLTRYQALVSFNLCKCPSEGHLQRNEVIFLKAKGYGTIPKEIMSSQRTKLASIALYDYMKSLFSKNSSKDTFNFDTSTPYSSNAKRHLLKQ